MELTIESTQTLVAIIGEQAVRDYRRCFRKRYRCFVRGDRARAIEYDQMLMEIESFFTGTWFGKLFPQLDGKELLDELRADCRRSLMN